MIDRNLLINKDLKILKTKTLCSFIATKPLGKRSEFVPQLNRIKKVHCAGKLFNNTKKVVNGRGDQKWKIKYINNFRFNISFENSISDGYVSEKIIHPMFVNSIPIYWGTDYVNKDFNSRSFLNYDNYSNDEEFINEIISIENDYEKYLNLLSQPWFNDSKYPDNVLPQNVLNFIEESLN